VKSSLNIHKIFTVFLEMGEEVGYTAKESALKEKIEIRDASEDKRYPSSCSYARGNFTDCLTS
jgi:hypothetical protein